MDDLASSELIDSPQVYIPIHALYRCCLDTLSSISAVALHDESFKGYYARLKIWGAGLFTEGPSLDRVLEEEPERYRPLLYGLQKTLFSIAVEEVVFLKSRHLFDGNSDIRLRLDPQTNTLLDLVSQNDTAILACERRLPHLATEPTIDTTEPLALQKSSSPDTRPSGSNQGKTREDESLKSQDARSGFINRLSKKLPAANEIVSLFTKNKDAVDRVQAASSGSGEHDLKEDVGANSSPPSEAYHGDYDTYLGDFVESLFDLLPSIRGVRRTRLLETEFQQSNERLSSSELVNESVPQSAQTEPGSEPGRLSTHNQEWPYRCDICIASFRRLHDLKRHTKVHTDERPYVCPKCDRSFARRDALARHNKGQGGCAGRRSSMGNFGGDDKHEDRMRASDGDGITLIMYPGEASHEPENDHSIGREYWVKQRVRSKSRARVSVREEERSILLKCARDKDGRFLQSISQQQLLQHEADWGDLLGAAPEALCILVQCFTATRVLTSSYQFPPESGLKEKSLGANLSHCSDLGRRAFRGAESKMQSVCLITRQIYEPTGPVDRALEMLDDEEPFEYDIRSQLNDLEKCAQNCAKVSGQILNEFFVWQTYAIQLRLACTAAEDQEEQRSRECQNRLALAGLPANPNETFHRQISLQEASRRASNDIPRGWTHLAQEAASGLTNSREKSDAGAGWDSLMPTDIVRQNKYKAGLGQDMDLAAEKVRAQPEKLLRERTEIESESTIDLENQFVDQQEHELANLQELKFDLKMCIRNLTYFLARLEKLLRLFSGLYQFLDVILEGPAQEYMAQVNNILTIDNALARGDQEKRQARMKSLKDELSVDALNLKGSYVIAEEMASVYVDISRQDITPALNYFEHLSLVDIEDTQFTPGQKVREMMDYAQKARATISAKAEKRRGELMHELYNNKLDTNEIEFMLGRILLEDVPGSDSVNVWDEA